MPIEQLRRCRIRQIVNMKRYESTHPERSFGRALVAELDLRPNSIDFLHHRIHARGR